MGGGEEGVVEWASDCGVQLDGSTRIEQRGERSQGQIDGNGCGCVYRSGTHDQIL